MRKGVFGFIISVFCFQFGGFSQYCANSGDCQDYFMRLVIGSKTFTGDQIRCADSSGYLYFVKDTIFLKAGDVIQVEIENEEFINTEVDMYLDTNLNGSWETPSEMTHMVGPYALVIREGTINVSPTQRSGISRLRFITYNTTNSPSNPCTTPAYQVIDFPVKFGGESSSGPPTYCAANGPCTNDYYIARVQITGENGTSINNSSLCDNYGDYTSKRVDLLGAKSYNLSITAKQNMYYGVAAVYVDWNNDGTFDQATETYQAVKKTDFTGYDATIDVPDSAITTGLKRMRIRNTMLLTTPAPCGTQANGEVEDYTVLYFNPTKPVPPCVSVCIPQKNSTNVCQKTTLRWSRANTATGYKVSLWQGNSPIFLNNVTTDTSLVISSILATNTQYKWIAVPYNDNGSAVVCDTMNFTTSPNQDPKVSLSPASNMFSCAMNIESLGGNPSLGTSPYTHQWTISPPEALSYLSATNTANIDFSAPAGSYKLVYRVNDVNNCTAWDTLFIEVNSNPSPPQILGPFDVCQGTPISLNASPAVVAPYTLQWQDSISGGTWSNNLNITKQGNTYIAPGIVQSTWFRAFISDPATGCKSLSNEVLVNVHPNQFVPPISVTGSLSPCPGEVSLLEINWNGSTTWNDPQSTTGNSLTVGQSGTYQATLIDQNGCAYQSDAVNITYKPGPAKPNIVANRLEACQGDSILLSTNSTDALQWNDPMMSTSQQIWAYTSGDYLVTASLPNGCSSRSEPLNLNFNSLPPSPIVLLIGSNPSCEDQRPVLEVDNPQPGSYIWNDANASAGTSFSPLVSGNYVVSYEDEKGCKSNSLNQVIVINPLPAKPTISASKNVICPGETISLQANPSNGIMWSDGSTQASLSINTPGSYYVDFTDANQCTSRSDLFELSAGEVPQTPIITQTGNSLFASSGPSFQWFTQGSAILGADQSEFSPGSTGYYAVIAFSPDGCPSDTSQAFFFSGVGIGAHQAANLKIYPNPAAQFVVISGIVGKDVKIECVDILGKSNALPISAQNENLILDLSKLSSGMYLLKIESAGLSFSKNFVVNK